MVLWNFNSYSQDVFHINNNGRVTKEHDISRLFKPRENHIRTNQIITDPLVLQKAARYALSFFQRKNLSSILKPAVYNNNLLNKKQVKDTLNFIINVIENDKKNNRNYRILDSNFLNKYFRFIKWEPDILNASLNEQKMTKGKIKLTNYATFEVSGAYNKNKWHPYALYSIFSPYFRRRERFKFTKQQIYNGVLNNPKYKRKIKPLVWLSKQGVEEALMQGSVQVRMPNGKRRIFSVDTNNGYEYDKKLQKRIDQKRYWYFKEVTNNVKSSRIKNFGIAGIQDFGGTVFAGDINNIGLGKIIAIRYRNNINKKIEMRLGVLVDTGGAFVNNLYQLDYYAGTFNSRWSFNKWRAGLPDNVEAYILVKA